MPSPLAFFIFSQVAIPCATSQEEMRKPGIAFLKAYTGEWYVDSWSRWCVVDKYDDWQHIQFHLRYLSATSDNRRWAPRASSRVGIEMSREQHRARQHTNTPECNDFICFTESRVSLSICMSTIAASPTFTIIIAADSSQLLEEKLDIWPNTDDIISQCDELPNLSLFQATLYRLVEYQYEEVSRAIRVLQQVCFTLLWFCCILYLCL
jgi:hypothetical protein